MGGYGCVMMDLWGMGGSTVFQKTEIRAGHQWNIEFGD
jgi:hypothetical protein